LGGIGVNFDHPSSSIKMRIIKTAGLLLLLVLNSNLYAQKALLQSGPMVGYSSMREVGLWVQTKESAVVQFQYWDIDKPEKKWLSDSYTTDKKDEFIAKIPITSLEPGKRYAYRLWINSRIVDFNFPLQFQTQTLWQWRTDPPEFTFALGSCTYINEEQYDRPGRPYGGDYQIFTSIVNKKPDFMLWLGDNIYLREADWDSRSGIMHRNKHARSLPELQPLFAGMHNYAIWDDHDFGPNDSNRSYWGKKDALDAFNLFWMNPNTDLTGKGGITSTFQWADVQFFMLDNRWFRTPNERKTGESCIICPDQFEWLIDALSSSQASFKFVVIGGQVINPARIHENHANYAEERERIIKSIRDENIPGVIFLTGDRHHTELSKFEEDRLYPLYDLTVSPLTSGTANPRSDENKLQVEGTLVKERNFGTIHVAGPRNERQMTIKIFNVDGGLIWERKIAQTDLK
jgi:alkaline phosphatase D